MHFLCQIPRRGLETIVSHWLCVSMELSIIAKYAHVLATYFTLDSRLVYTSNPEDGGDIFLRNVYRLSTDYMALYLRR
jgi:hypothetical protein